MTRNIPLKALITRVQATLESLSLVLTTFVFATIVGAVLYSVLTGNAPTGTTESFTGRLINIVALQLLSIPLIAYVYIELTDRSLDFININWPSTLQLAIAGGGTVGLVGLNYAIIFIFTYVDIPIAPAQLTNLSDPAYYLILAATSIFIIAPSEELLFRGIIQQRLTEVFSPVGAILIASAIFSLPHYQALILADGRLASLVLIFLLGCVLGVVYFYTKNLVIPIIMHALFNVFAFMTAYLNATAALTL